jgi:hypothetical protein
VLAVLLLCRLCLEAYHLLAIGMPDPATQSSIVSTRESDSNVCEQQEQQDDDGSAGAESMGLGAQPPPSACEKTDQEKAEVAAEVTVPVRAAMTDAGAAVSTPVLAIQPVACSAGGSLNTLPASSNSTQATPALVRSVLPQLPLPHLLHLELDGCR